MRLAATVACLVILPLLEIYVVIQVGHWIGPWWTVALLLLVSIVGAVILKYEGRKAWRNLRDVISSGRAPGKELADGALLIVGGTLLLTPGFVTDVIGFFCVLPPTRPLARRLLLLLVRRRVTYARSGDYAPRDRGGAHQIYHDDQP